MGDVKNLIARFRQSPDAVFSAQEAEALAAAGEVMAAKIAALHFFKSGELPRCSTLMEWILSQEISEENVINYAVALRDQGKSADAVSVLRQHEPHIAPIQFHGLMASCLNRIGQRAESVRHGDETLRLKDAQSPPSPPPRPLKIHAFNIETPRRNIIAFSVFGDNPRYLTGAINNAIVGRYLYPGWTVRVYTDESTPVSFRQELKRNAAEVVLAGDLPAAPYGLYWRFLVEDDESVDLFLVRDADSVINIKERAAVAAWLKSGKAFHVMRDHPQHSELILAGLWGAHRGNIGGMRERIVAFYAKAPKRANYVHRDQDFLRQEIWPLVRQSVHVHDSVFSFMSPDRFDPDYGLPAVRHVGQNDWIFYKRTKPRS